MMGAVVLATALLAGPVVDPATQAAIIPSHQRAFAECVSDRESGGDYRAENPTSTASGRWQFLDSRWREGLAWMVAARLRDHGLSASESRRIRLVLRSTDISEWSPQYQDAGFIAVLNARGPFSGWRHWYHPDSRCNSLAVN